jgi:osmotically-inducible protein OsmY
MRNGRMAGIVIKTDLVRAVAQSAKKTTEDQTNAELQKALWNAIRGEPWLQSAFLNLTVKDGVVELYGAVQSPDQRRAVLVLVKGVAGVRDVNCPRCARPPNFGTLAPATAFPPSRCWICSII